MSTVREDSVASRNRSTRDSPLFVLEGRETNDKDDQLLKATSDIYYREGFDPTSNDKGGHSFR